MTMSAVVINIDAYKIRDWDGFHLAFQRALGFPNFYGQNMDAWIDCMSSVDDPASGMTRVSLENGGMLVLEISGVRAFREACPIQYSALLECSAFVNYRRVKAGEKPVLSLALVD